MKLTATALLFLSSESIILILPNNQSRYKRESLKFDEKKSIILLVSWRLFLIFPDYANFLAAFLKPGGKREPPFLQTSFRSNVQRNTTHGTFTRENHPECCETASHASTGENIIKHLCWCGAIALLKK
jgi:hypothetical protein